MEPYYLFDKQTSLLTIIGGDETLYVSNDSPYQDYVFTMCMAKKDFQEIKDYLNKVNVRLSVSRPEQQFQIKCEPPNHVFIYKWNKDEFQRVIPNFMLKNIKKVLSMPKSYQDRYFEALKTVMINDDFPDFENNPKEPQNIENAILYKNFDIGVCLIRDGKQEVISLNSISPFSNRNLNIDSDLIYLGQGFQSNYNELKDFCIKIVKSFWKKDSFPYDGLKEYESLTRNIILSGNFISLFQAHTENIPEDYIDYIGASFYSPKKLFHLLLSVASEINLKN